jgi:hypothetical protein
VAHLLHGFQHGDDIGAFFFLFRYSSLP